MSDRGSPSEELLTTGIPGLDTVLRGGLRKGRTYMVMGEPGAGKTILANQLCFHHARQGEQVLYLTLLAESHTDLIANLRGLSFFDSALLPSRMAYLSAFTILEDGGLEALLELIRKEVKLRGATFLVLDGLVAAEEAAPSQQAFKRFIHSLQVVTGIMGCSTLVLTTGGGQGLRAEHTMVDGLLVLQQRTFGVRTLRELYVRKFRGGPHLLGRHGFEITQDGLVVYPRLEALLTEATSLAPEFEERQSFGIAGLDAALRGGLPAGSTTILFGPSGSGKTLLGMSFLAHGAQRGEHGHYFAFYDSPPRMLAQTAGVGLDLAPLVERGELELSFRPPTENVLDKLGFQLLSIVRSRRVRRLFLDGYEALHRAAVRRSRLAHFMAALVNECRLHGVTLLFSAETMAAFGPELRYPMRGLSMVAENVLFMRSVELDGELRRILCVLKMRNSGYDPSIRELLIGERGLEVGDQVEDAQHLLTGLARWPSTRLPPREGRSTRRSP